MAKKKEPVEKEENEVINPDQTLEKLQAELNETKDMLLRTAAEYDNFKKRSEREREHLSKFVASQTVKAFLSPYDNLERALNADSSSEDYLKGIELTIKQMKEVFTKLGLIEFGEVGDEFNPELYEAVMHKEDDSLPENSVSNVMQKGYMFGDIVIRHAMVEVAN